jgi:hypothetical protein
MGRPAGSIVEVRVKGTVNAQKVMTVLHYKVGNPSALDPAGPEETALFGALSLGATAITDKYRACCSVDYTMDGIDVQFITNTRFVNVFNAIAGAGTFAGVCDAQNLSAVITKKTELAARNQVGSVHIPGLSVNSYLAGFTTAALKALMNTLAAALLFTQAPGLGGGTYLPVIFHRGDPHAIPPILPSDDLMQAAFPQDTLRVMRRRTIGVGK